MEPTNRYAFFEGRIVPIEDAKISVMTSALHYGTAVFEGIRGYWCGADQRMLVVALDEHLGRLQANCRVLEMVLPYSLPTLHDAVLELLDRERFTTDCYIRPLVYKSSRQIGVRLHDLDCDCCIFATPFGRYIKREGGITAVTSSWRRVEDNAIPARGKIAGAYVNSALAKSEAVRRGADEAIVLTEGGHVSEASAANLFIARNGTLITPPVTDNILEGIVRGLVLGWAHEMGIPCRERSIDRTELYAADELFLCGTGIELTAVIDIDGRPIGGGREGPLFLALSERFDQAVHGRSEADAHRLTPIVYSS
jgi:branched-chain amino acid aminotransferase